MTVLSVLSPLASMASAFGLDEPFSAFRAQEPGGRALLVARGGLLAVAWWATSATAASATRTTTAGTPLASASRERWFAAVGLAFVASLAARCLFVPFALLATIAAARNVRALATSVAILVGVVVSAAWAAPPAAIDDLTASASNPVTETALWAERDNPFRARFWAAEWAARETGLGRGHLVLARANWALGHANEARQSALQLSREAENPEVRAQAEALLRDWNGAPP